MEMRCAGSSTVQWLLERDNPSVRYFTLLDIMGRSPADMEVAEAKRSIIDDPRVQHGIEWMVKYQRFDDGAAKRPRGYPYDRFENCWGRHTCHMGVVKALKALSEVPEARVSPSVERVRQDAAEYLLKHHIYRKSHDIGAISKPEWLQFGFPLMWNTDVLEILEILTKLGYRDSRMQDAIDVANEKRTSEGNWLLDSTFNGRVIASIERKGYPSKWVTMSAIRVLKRYHGDTEDHCE